MRLIVVKSFTESDLVENIPPSLSVEVDGRIFEILNFRNRYYCTSYNTLAGRDNQVKIDDSIYSDVHSIIYSCLKTHLKEGKPYMIVDSENLVHKFFSESRKFYGECLLDKVS